MGFLPTIAALAALLGTPAAKAQIDLNAPSPIAAHASLWTEDLTAYEVRDAVRAGTTTIIIGAGGVEYNGPYMVSGKHNYVLQTVLPYIARDIGHALIAPVVKFVPEGSIEPPSGHMLAAATISVEPATFQALLTDICRSYKAHGFVDIVLVGDSGSSQAGMKAVAEALNSRWAGEETRVHYLPEYYAEDKWSYAFLKARGVVQIDKAAPAGEAPDRPAAVRNGIHDDIYYQAQVAVQNPALIRTEERRKAGLFSLHGVALDPLDKTVSLGRDLAQYRARITAQAFRESLRRLRSK